MRVVEFPNFFSPLTNLACGSRTFLPSVTPTSVSFTHQLDFSFHVRMETETPTPCEGPYTYSLLHRATSCLYRSLPSGISIHQHDDQAAPKLPCRLLVTKVTYMVQALGIFNLFSSVQSEPTRTHVGTAWSEGPRLFSSRSTARRLFMYDSSAASLLLSKLRRSQDSPEGYPSGPSG